MSNAIPDSASAQNRVRRSQAMRESSVSLLVKEVELQSYGSSADLGRNRARELDGDLWANPEHAEHNRGWLHAVVRHIESYLAFYIGTGPGWGELE